MSSDRTMVWRKDIYGDCLSAISINKHKTSQRINIISCEWKSLLWEGCCWSLYFMKLFWIQNCEVTFAPIQLMQNDKVFYGCSVWITMGLHLDECKMNNIVPNLMLNNISAMRFLTPQYGFSPQMTVSPGFVAFLSFWET